MALIEVRPVPRTEPWHGVSDPEKQFIQDKVYEVLFNVKTGRYDLNMTSEEKEHFEKILGTALDDTFDYQKPHPLFSTRTYQIRLPNRTIFFNDSIPLEAFKVHIMKSPNFRFVANSYREWEEGDYPEATHIIYDEKDEVAIKASLIQSQTACLKIASKLTLEEKAALVRIISGEAVRKETQDYVDVALDAILKKKAGCEQFMELAERKKGTLLIESTIYNAIDKNVIIKQKGQYTYLGDIIGNDVDEIVRWFSDPQNSELKKTMLDRIKA